MIEFAGRIIITVICLGLVVVLHEYGHFLMARYLGVRVERFTVGFGPEILGWTRGDTRYAICAVPLGGMVKLAGEFMDERENKPDEFFSQPWYSRITIALAGPLVNYILAFILFALVAGVWGVLQPSDQPVIGDMVAGLPAAESQLHVGDRIRKINDHPVETWEQMADVIHQAPEQKLTLQVERLGEHVKEPALLSITLVPKRDPEHGVGLIGIMPRVDKIKPGFSGSFAAAGRDIKVWTLQPLRYLTEKISRWEGPKELSGPVGIAMMVTKATKEGVSYVIYLIAIISTGLGLFNLFPIPVLDGGHVFLYVIEGIIRRPLNRKVMQLANVVGLSLVMTIFVYATRQDYLRYMPEILRFFRSILGKTPA